MYRFVWSKEVLNYLKDNVGMIDDLELAFGDLRKTKDGYPEYGIVDKDFSENRYTWTVHEHKILIRIGIEDSQAKLWLEAIQPAPKSKNSSSR